MPLTVRVSPFLLLAVLGAGLLVLGCDQVSRPEARQPPSVSRLAVTPDTLDAAVLDPVPDQDSLVQDTVGISAFVADPDGEIARVPFVIEPASNPRGTIAGRLTQIRDSLYAGGVILSVPRFRSATYTVRVYAVDDDSLASNQGIGQLRVLPDS